MNPLILNRDFQHPADGWYDIEVPGNHPNKRAGIIQVIDARAVESIVDNFNHEADAAPNFAGMLIDHEHFKHDDDKETRAYGWLMRLRNKDGRPQGQIRWTGTGKQAVDDGDYRFFSSEYDPAEMEPVDNSSIRNPQSAIRNQKFLRPLRLDGLTLTNMPNNKGQKPITNRNPMPDNQSILNRLAADGITEQVALTVLNRCFGPDAPVQKILDGDYVGHEFHGNQFTEGHAGLSRAARASRNAHQASNDADSARQHVEAAGLHEQAAKEHAAKGHNETAMYHQNMAEMHKQTAIGMIHNREQSPNGPAASAATNPITMNTVIKKLGLHADAAEPAVLAEVTKLLNRNSELESALIDADLDTYSDRIPDGQEAFVRQMLITNREGALDYLKALPVAGRATAPLRVHNRNAAEDPNQSAGAPDDESLRRNRNDAIEECRLKNRCTYETAVNMVRNRNPELFGLAKRGE